MIVFLSNKFDWNVCFPVVILAVCGLFSNQATFSQLPKFEFDKNSTRKIRTQPSETAARIGSAIRWREDFNAALNEAKQTGKPIFWYVPTLRGSFMDRKTEIDRYMMAGPFSWPEIINLVNENYIPVKAKPNSTQQKQYSVVPYVFIEPGFLILDPNGKTRLKIDRLTTLHPQWFRQVLAPPNANSDMPNSKPDHLIQAWEHFRNREYDQVQLDALDASPEFAAEQWLLQGMAHFRMGDHVAAREAWQKASRSQPDHPLAWKAAAEAEMMGPFVRGFEVHCGFPAKALTAGTKSPGSAAPVGTYNEADIWNRSLDFLLSMQADSGVYADSDYDFGGTDSLPNVHVAVTSIAGMALLAASEQLPVNDPRHEQIAKAVKAALSFVSNDENLNFRDRDELVWALAFRIRFMARFPGKNDKQMNTFRRMVDTLTALQSASGGWFHEYPNSFVTATALAALKEAQRQGIEVSMGTIDKGTQSLASDRFDNGAYPYSSGRPNSNRKATEKDIAASAGRMPLCELALFNWNRSTVEALTRAIGRSFELNDNLMVALKYDDHTSRLAYGGFFFWYDIRGRSEAIALLPESVSKQEFQSKQKKLILSLPELDGCFVDSHELGRVYGTAMALLSLADCQ